jgi:hypothetical protein
MFLSYFTLFVALSLSAVAAWYSIIGLTAIFAAAVVPIIIMGGILEVAKITITVWLHEYWHRCRWLMKVYLVPAVVLLMVITSMGIFGFLSKAHLDQTVPTGDVQAQVALFDEKIQNERLTIEDARRLLKQLDDAVIGIQSGEGREIRNRDGTVRIENPAERALAVRRSQARDRAALTAAVEEAQTRIVGLQEQRAPVAAELRKVEAEVGPIKYIAALIYGDDPDANLLEKAVRWVIILLVVVFDPLAIMMVLAATESIKWRRETPVEPAYPPDNDPLTDEQLDQIQATAPEPVYDPDTANALIADLEPEVPEPALPEKPIFEQHPYLTKGFAHFENLPPIVASVPAPPAPAEVNDPDDDENDNDIVKQAKHLWKLDNPTLTLKEQRRLMSVGEIDHEPWQDYLDDPRIARETGFGKELPLQGLRGDLFVLTSAMPTRLYKHTGKKWIEIDKNKTDVYTYNQSYIEYLMTKIESSEYDPELLTEGEQQQIKLFLEQATK